MTTTTPRWRVVRKLSFTWYQGYCWAAIYGTEREDWQRYEEFRFWEDAYVWAKRQADNDATRAWSERVGAYLAATELGPMPTPEAISREGQW